MKEKKEEGREGLRERNHTKENILLKREQRQT